MRNCVLWNDWGRCLEIGAETRAEEICDIVFEDCQIIHVTLPVLDCQNADFAFVHDVTYRNIDVEYDDVIPEAVIQSDDDMSYKIEDPDYVPPIIAVSVVYHHEYSAKGERRGKNKDIRFENIRLYGRQLPKIQIESYSEEYASTDILIKNFSHNGVPLKDTEYEISIDDHSKNVVLE